jgi:hypothetical protein
VGGEGGACDRYQGPEGKGESPYTLVYHLELNLPYSYPVCTVVAGSVLQGATFGWTWKSYPSKLLDPVLTAETSKLTAYFSTHLDIRNSDGSLMVFISTALPNRMRDILEQNLLASMENITLLHDQAGNHEEDDADDDDERQGRFGALHLSWYNRHCTQV